MSGSFVTTDRPLVSVIMNCYNGEAYLREAIESVLAQTYRNFEIIFYDNASTDGSAAIAQSYGESVRYFRGEQTIPLGAARNTAIAQANGDLIAFLDTDDRWLPQKLEMQLARFAECLEADFCYTNCHVLDAATGRMHLGFHSPQPEGEVFRAFLRYYPVNLQTVMVRKPALDKLGALFDADMHVSEEYDLFIRLLYRSKACYLTTSTAIYRIHCNMASLRHIEKYPVENSRVLAKLRDMVPSLDRDYQDEVAYLEAKIGYWYAAAHMHKGERLSARRSLRPYIGRGTVFTGLFLATFLPVGVWRLLQRMRPYLRFIWA